MSSRCLISAGQALVLALALVLPAAARAEPTRVLKVCAEPNNMPFSNRHGDGFENRIADLIANEIGAKLVRVLIAQHGPGFVRATLASGRCDALMGWPEGARGVATTRPYYRTTWMFVTRADAGPAPTSFDDPRLPGAAVGVAVVGEGADTAPVVALGRRGIVEHLRRYAVGGDLGDGDDAAARMVADVANGTLDVALVWGPFAGYYASRQKAPLSLTPTPESEGDGIPLTLPISIAVKAGSPLRDELDAALARRASDIAAILAEYGVPDVGR
jgi:mxaJ protein